MFVFINILEISLLVTALDEIGYLVLSGKEVTTVYRLAEVSCRCDLLVYWDLNRHNY